jgi:lipid-A-disaccharide synthase-like uncharacterized protein
MDSIMNFVWHDGKLFGHQWTHWEIFWNVIGWGGQVLFFSRFFIQWYATEKNKSVVVPQAFWWLSIIGSLLMLLFAAFYDKHWVVVFSYAFNWIPYIRNLIIHRRSKAAQFNCTGCGQKTPPHSNFCPNCGLKLA